jgi:hypothetical protein
MTIENPKVVDCIGIEKDGSGVTLTISDHLEWGDRNHLLCLQDKVNSYLSFIESGEIYEEYPSANGKKQKIWVACKYEPDEEAKEFLSRCKDTLEQGGFGFSYNVPEI